MVKVIIGVRRAGKSVVMGQYIRRLKDNGTDPKDMLFIDFESSDYEGIADCRVLVKS